MKRTNIIFFIAFLAQISLSFGQNTFKAIIKDEKTKETLVLVNVKLEDSNIGGVTDTNGVVVLQNIPDGKQSIEFSYVGYRSREKSFVFPMKEEVSIYLETEIDLDEVCVYSTRTNNRIKEIPTRIEVLGNEEVVEETAISPGNISKLLGETSGIQVQNTSAVSGNVSFRIQGLPGKYTQLIQDGFPMYSGFSSGLSLLQIPPLNLLQVEIIKGSASTLYGGDAIAGIVNLISKKPAKRDAFSVMLNQTHKGGRDISSYYSATKGKLGISMLASINTQNAKDVSANGFSDMPGYHRAVINPNLYYQINENNQLMLGLFSTFEDRIGGDMKAVDHQADELHEFYEENKTKRNIARLKYEHKTKDGNILSFKSSFGSFDRALKTNTNYFRGVQSNIFNELSYYVNAENHQFTSGINYYSDDFNQKDTSLLSYHHQTVGVFAQDNWKLNKTITLEPGLRYDYSFNYGSFFLPRLALMLRLSDHFFSRLSAGMGYKLPTPFTDEADRTRFQDVRPLVDINPEKSMGLNLDFNYKTPLFDELFLSFNQAFFYTEIQNPIIVNQDLLAQQTVSYENAVGDISSKGLNTNIRLSLDELILYIDYTYLDARKKYDDNKQLEITPQNRLTTTLAYEDEEEGWKAGLEAFYFGNQYREDGTQTPDYWLLGASVQKTFGHITIALNTENILDVRQTKYEHIISGNLNNPVFNEIYAPLDGFVANMVLKFDL